MNKRPLRLGLLGYNQKTTEMGLRYFINNNIEQVEGVNWVNREIPMKGVKFNIDYDNNDIEYSEDVDIQTSFSIDGVYGEYD